ncbi:MAG: acylphosphatase [Ruminococcus sp.]|nr:acylphosphatase [Ruminococcus sp.]
MEKIRKHIIFSGSVQRVGFRKRALNAALKYGVCGWVKNLSDGTVEMEAEGTENAIDSVILSIEKGWLVRIENLRVKSLPVCGYGNFEIRE